MGENHLSYREVIPHQFAPRRWKDICVQVGGAQSTLQDIKLPECAGGYSFKDSNCAGSVVRNRFIYWKSYNDVFELIEHSLDYNLTGNHVRLRFHSSPVLDGISISETNDKVVVLVATVSSVHRLMFAHPKTLHQYENLHMHSVDQVWPSIFADTSVSMVRDPSNCFELGGTSVGNILPQCAATYLTRDGDAVFAVAYGGGNITVICMPHGSTDGVLIYELTQSTTMQRLWTGIVPASFRSTQDTGDTVLSLCMHCIENKVYLFTLSRDHKLRIWLPYINECKFAVDIIELLGNSSLNTSSKQLGSQPHCLRKVQDSNDDVFYLGAFLCFADRKQICIFEPVFESDKCRLLLITTIHCPDFRLIDFSLTMTCIWSLWINLDSESVLKYAEILGEQSSNLGWNDANLETLAEKEYHLPEGLMEPREAYMQQIFKPGNFSVQTISKAINIYRRSVDKTVIGEMNVPVNILKEEVTTVVENEIHSQASEYELNDDDYLQLQLEAWSKFYSCCIQYQEVEAKMMGIMVDNQTGMICLIKKSGFSLLRPQNGIEVLTSKDSATRSYGLSRLSSLSEDNSLLPDLLSLSECLSLIENHLRDEVKEAFLQDLFHQQSPESVANALINSLVIGTDDQSSSLLQQIIKSVSRPLISNLIPCIEILLMHLDLANGQPEVLTFEDDLLKTASQQISCNRLFASHVGASVVAEAVSQRAKVSLDLCRNLLLLMSFLLRAGEPAGITTQVAQKIRKELLPQANTLTQAYYVLRWISQEVATDITRNTMETGLCQLAVMNIAETSQSTVTVSKFQKLFSQPMTLLEAFVHLDGGMQARSLLAQTSFMEDDRNAAWMDALSPLIHIVAQLLWPVGVHFAFPEFLFIHCQYLQLLEYVRLLQNWCNWNCSSRKFLLGQIYLNLGEADKAVECYMQAADGLEKDEFLNTKILDSSNDGSTDLLTLYFLKVSQLIEQAGYPDQVITVAKAAVGIMDKKDSNLGTLWSIIFKHHLQLEHNEEAYAALNVIPEASRKNYCLRKFVVTLSERKQYKALVEFPYVDLHDEFVSILESRARSIDLMTHNYYDILYSFHIFRSNYRKAGSIMYEYGMRLGNETPGLKGLQKQAKCYLTALNCLRLLNPNYAWIIKPVPTVGENESTHSGMSPKRNYDGEEKISRPSKCKVEVLEFSSIKKEYDLLHARLHLYKKDLDPSSITGPLSADETVGLLTNIGLYDMALHIATIFKLPLQPIFEGLASGCVKLAELSCNSSENANALANAWDWLLENETSRFCSADTNVIEQSWVLLQSYLQSYEVPGQTQYHWSVTEKLLSLGSHLPNWLVTSYKMTNIAELIGLYLDYDLLESAAALAIEYIDAVLGRGKEYFGLKSSLHPNAPPVWLPYSKLDYLLLALKENSEDPSYNELYLKLSDRLNVYRNNLETVSRDMIMLRQGIN